MECAHSICTCQVGTDQYCSDHCREMAETRQPLPDMSTMPPEPADSLAQDCGCGHDQCIARSSPQF